MVQIQYMAPWVPAFRSACSGELDSNESQPFITLQFATIGKDGFPHVRTMVYRGFLFDNKASNVLVVVSDKRMKKYGELLENDKFEAVFYFSKVRKQFRFRGRARIIDDKHKPVIDLSNIQPGAVTNNSTSENASHRDGISTQDKSCQEMPISHSIISSGLQKEIELRKAPGFTVADVSDISDIELYPPTVKEYDEEILRQWGNLSKNLKKSFRKPSPATIINDENQKQIDSISRGVDGKKEEDGLKNFAVLALFVDYVDLYEMEKDRRYIYEKDDYQLWSEVEVCP